MSEPDRTQSAQPEGGDISRSFSAYKTRLAQEKQLKNLRRDLVEHEGRLDEMRATLRDNRDILEHFDTMSVTLYDTIEGNAKLLTAARARAQQADTSAEKLRCQLEETQTAHAQALAPESEALFAANSELANAQAQARECKGQLGQARKLAKGAEASDGAQDALMRAQAAAEAADARHRTAQEAKTQAQRAYDAKAATFRQSEDAVTGDIRLLEKEADRARKDAAEIEGKLEEAKARLSYCEHVYDNPAETDELEVSISAAEAHRAAMLEAIESLEHEHEQTKEPSSLARNIVAALIGIAIFLLVGTIVMHFVL